MQDIELLIVLYTEPFQKPNTNSYGVLPNGAKTFFYLSAMIHFTVQSVITKCF
jgi:hypothetical protein